MDTNILLCAHKNSSTQHPTTTEQRLQAQLEMSCDVHRLCWQEIGNIVIKVMRMTNKTARVIKHCWMVGHRINGIPGVWYMSLTYSLRLGNSLMAVRLVLK